jgi:hypothetical protein
MFENKTMKLEKEYLVKINASEDKISMRKNE